MSEIKTALLKIPAELKYFADDKERTSDGETFVITEDHTINDILRFCVEQTDLEEVKSAILFLET